ncbi:TATA binding protein associated factor [Aphelenchoides besseyi]|nr:TATA binding protein associated factor [Aphelenchoides besseyi]
MPMVNDSGRGTVQAQQKSTTETLNCSFTDYSVSQQFRVISQHVTLNQLDCKNEQFSIITEIQLLPMKNSIKTLTFHLGQNSRLPNEENGPSNGVVTVQEIPTKYYRNTRKLKLSENPQKKNLRYLKNSLQKYYDDYNGDLVVEIPDECADVVQERRVLIIKICTNVVRPKHGLKFHCKFDADGNLEEGTHIFTYRSNIFSSTKEWLPCLDGSDQLSMWRFAFAVPEQMSVICSGELTEVIENKRDKLKVFVYHATVPIAPVNIGFVIGDLECHTQPELPDLTSYTLPGLKSILEYTVTSLPRILSCLEETLSCRFPFPSYKQVFIDNVPEEVISYAGLSIFSINLLYHKKILDAVQSTRQIMALGLSSQFFGCFVNAADFKNLWLVKSLARCMTALYIEKSFGTSEYIYQTNRLLEVVCDYEEQYGPVILHPSTSDTNPNLYFDPLNPVTCSSNYADVMYKKGQFVMRTLQNKLGKESFLKVLHRILVVASEFSRNMEKPIDWYHMIISLDSFFLTVTSVTGRELPSFLEMFVYDGGHANFEISSYPNRKRNIVEIEIRQEAGKGRRSYVGPLTIYIQELDGYFPHTLQIDADVSKHDLQCHSKGRRQKRKKVVISTGEEVDIDLSSIDPDSPILWIRVDPNMLLIRKLNITQPVHQLEYMLRYEHCAVAQCEAVDQLRNFPVQQTHNVLLEAVENDHFFHRVRNRAAFCLTEICNRLPDGLLPRPAPLMTYFQQIHCASSDPKIPSLLNFVATTSNLQTYFLMQTLPQAIGRVRRNGKCPTEVVDFLLVLLKCNDNSINRYSDDHYRSSLITGIASTLTSADPSLKDPSRPDILPQQIDDIVCEVVTALNKDQLQPSYCRVVASSCLKALLLLQRYNYLPVDPAVFWAFAQSESVFSQLRINALVCLASLVSRTHNVGLTDTVMRMFEMLVNDSNPQIRYSLGNILVMKPPFNHSHDITGSLSYASNTKRLADLMYSMITDLSLEPRIRTYAVDIFYAMYSTDSPLMFLSEEERHRLESQQRDNLEMNGSSRRQTMEIRNI